MNIIEDIDCDNIESEYDFINKSFTVAKASIAEPSVTKPLNNPQVAKSLNNPPVVKPLNNPPVDNFNRYLSFDDSINYKSFDDLSKVYLYMKLLY